MNLGDIQLRRPYRAGSGGIAVNNLAPILATMVAVPSRATIFSVTTPGISTTYLITSIGGTGITLGAVQVGTDQDYPAGSPVQLQCSVADAAAGSAVGTVTSIIAGTGLSGGTITTTGTIGVATSTIDTLAGFSHTGVFGSVTVSTGLSLSGGVLTATGGSGTVTSVIAGTGLSGGTITTTGTISLTNPVTAALGGTGLATLTAHAVMVGAGTSNVAFATVGTSGRPLIDQGGSADPAFLATGVKIDSHFGAITTDTVSAGAVTCNLATSDKHNITLVNGTPTTISLSNATTGQVFRIKLIQDGSGSGTVVWFTTIKWAGGSAPTLTTTASRYDVFVFECTGSNTFDGNVVGQNYA